MTLTSPCTWFEHVSMLVILLNCVTLGMFQPCEDVSCQSEWCRILQVSVTLTLLAGLTRIFSDVGSVIFVCQAAFYSTT